MYAESVEVHTLSGILTCWIYQENHADHLIEVLCMMMEDLFVNRKPCLDNTVHSIEQPSFCLFHPLCLCLIPLTHPTFPPTQMLLCFVYWQEL